MTGVQRLRKGRVLGDQHPRLEHWLCHSEFRPDVRSELGSRMPKKPAARSVYSSSSSAPNGQPVAGTQGRCSSASASSGRQPPDHFQVVPPRARTRPSSRVVKGPPTTAPRFRDCVASSGVSPPLSSRAPGCRLDELARQGRSRRARRRSRIGRPRIRCPWGGAVRLSIIGPREIRGEIELGAPRVRRR